MIKINWNKDGANVICCDGSSYSADYLIVTSSLGVLRDRHMTLFDPPLPKRKRTAIETLGFGPVNKIFLHFSSPWWSPETKGFSFVWPKGYTSPKYEEFRNQLCDEV